MVILRCIGGLPRRQREAIVLVEWLALDVAEAAEILGVKPTTVRGLTFDARRRLREQLGVDDA